jgi:frataxin-like iron-binding protein CyaY
METTLQQSSKLPKPFGKQAISEYQKTLHHLIWMASMQGAKKYAWDRAKKLDADPSGLWAGITDDLTKAMNENSGKNRQQSK